MNQPKFKCECGFQEKSEPIVACIRVKCPTCGRTYLWRETVMRFQLLAGNDTGAAIQLADSPNLPPITAD